MDSRSQRFTFTHTDTVNDRQIDFSVGFEEGQAHDEVVAEFLNFLSGVYGYDLRDSYGLVVKSVEDIKAQEAFDSYDPESYDPETIPCCVCDACSNYGGND